MDSTGDAEPVIVNFAERPYGKELVPAGDAAVRGHAQETLEGGGKTGYMLGRDAFQVVITANGAMGGKAVGERRRAAAKSLTAARATPGQAAYKSGGEIHKGASARPTAGRRMAGGANHQRCPLSDLGLRR